MKIETTETMTVTKTTYTCDVCHEPFKAGQKPYVCCICVRDVCADHARWWLRPLARIEGAVCDLCWTVGDNFIVDWHSLENRFNEESDRILQLWKDASKPASLP